MVLGWSVVGYLWLGGGMVWFRGKSGCEGIILLIYNTLFRHLPLIIDICAQELAYLVSFAYICGMRDTKGIIVFDIAARSFDVYKDISDAAGHVGMVIARWGMKNVQD